MEQAQAKRDNHTPSCAVCQRRKVKCDRVYPCAACTKSGLECTFPPPRAAKRPRRNNSHRYEAQAPGSVSQTQTPAQPDTTKPRQSSTSKTPNNDFSSPESTQSTGRNTARLVPDGTGYRYVNNHLYDAISADGQGGTGGLVGNDSTPEPRSGYAAYDDGARGGDDTSMTRSFLFGNGQQSSTPLSEVPQLSAAHSVFLWQTYLANIDPVMKISHAPTVQQLLLGQIGRSSVPRAEHALTCAIHFISIVSLTNQQCLESLQEPRHSLLQKYREATEAALTAANFITTTDSTVLLGFILYLAALRTLGEVQTVWPLFGLAIRIAGTIGLPRDGSSFGLSPFEIEMRRRLWWGIVYFDGRMAELVGQDGDLMGADYEAGSPSNLNDSDLFPSMTRLPEPRKGPTEAVYLQARILCVTVARSLQSLSGPQGTWHRLQDADMTVSEKLEIMRGIEQRYNEEILDVCDPTVPIQWLSMNTARTFSTKLRLIARIPIVNLEGEWEDTNGFSENAFLLSMDLLQTQVDLWCEPMVQQWRWHWSVHFQWYALVTLLRQTRLRGPGHGISRAWSLIQKAFEIIVPTLGLNPRKNLLLKGIHELLDAAKRQQDQSSSASSVPTPHPDGSHAVLPTVLKPLNTAFSTGFGSRPHSALLPGTNTAQIASPAYFGQGHFDEQAFGLDLEAIDWVEFDRLASELCQQ